MTAHQSPVADDSRSATGSPTVSASRSIGFVVRSDASQLEQDLRDGLLALESDEYHSSDCAGPLTRLYWEAAMWIGAAAFLWVFLALFF